MYTEVRNNPFLITTNNPFSLWLGEIFGMQVIGDNLHPDINRGFTVSGVNPRIGGVRTWIMVPLGSWQTSNWLKWPAGNRKISETKTKNDTLSSEVKNSTMVASPVKMDIYKSVFNGLLSWIIQVGLVQWGRASRHCLWRPFCHRSSLDGCVDWAVYALKVYFQIVGASCQQL